MSTAPANIIQPGVSVFCDPNLGPAMRSLDRISRPQAGAPVNVLSAPATSMLRITDVKTDPRLTVLATLNADPQLTNYSRAVNTKALSPSAQAMLIDMPTSLHPQTITALRFWTILWRRSSVFHSKYEHRESSASNRGNS
jgi:hypothetical protein